MHWLGLTPAPFYYEGLVSPYHDSLIAILLGAIAILFLQAARHTDNKQLLETLAYISGFGGFTIFFAGLLVNFDAYDASGKQMVSLLEGVYFVSLAILLKLYLSRISKVK